MISGTAAVTGTPPSRSDTARPAVHLDSVSKTYGKGDAAVVALDRVTLSFERRRFTAIMGPSGSGKSTLLHCLAGLDPVDEGRVLIDDVDLTRLRDDELTRLRRDRIGFVFQAFNLVPVLTVEENILLPFILSGRRPDQAWVNDVVATLGIGERLHHRPAQLSGGQQQRVACARALVTRPDVVVADEPTGNLDRKSGGQVLTALRDSVDLMGQTVVMVTHDPAAASRADRVVVLADGSLVAEIHQPTIDVVLDIMKSLGE